MKKITAAGYETFGMKMPARMVDSIDDYINHGVIPGHFLQAIICNDLEKAVAHADSENLPLLSMYVRFFYNKAPRTSWGSYENMNTWAQGNGLVGDDKRKRELNRKSKELDLDKVELYFGKACECGPIYEEEHGDTIQHTLAELTTSSFCCSICGEPYELTTAVLVTD